MRTWLTQRLVFPGIQLVLRNGVWDHYRELDATQWHSPRQIRELQDDRLRCLLHHAYAAVPLYRRAFDDAGISPSDIGTAQDLARLPVQTKATLRANYPHDAVARDVPSRDRIANSTSGSTGSPFEFMMDRRLMGMRWARYLRGNTWTDMAIGERVLRIWGRHDKPWYERLAVASTLNMREVSAFGINRHTVRRYAEIIRAYRPRCLEAYTSAIVKLVRTMRDAGITDVSIPAVVVSAETLYQPDRELIEEILHCQVFDRYGAREFGGIAHECARHDGLHIHAESFVVEVVPESREPGGPGKLIVTNLDNFTMPFIRYEIGDRGVLGAAPCACGRGLPLLVTITGRTTDFLETPSGDIIPFLYWNYFFEQYGRSIAAFQVVQEQPDSIVVKVVPTSAYDHGVRAGIVGRLRGQFGAELRIELVEVDDIPLSSAGKHVTVQKAAGARSGR